MVTPVGSQLPDPGRLPGSAAPGACPVVVRLCTFTGCYTRNHHVYGPVGFAPFSVRDTRVTWPARDTGLRQRRGPDLAGTFRAGSGPSRPD